MTSVAIDAGTDLQPELSSKLLLPISDKRRDLSPPASTELRSIIVARGCSRSPFRWKQRRALAPSESPGGDQDD
jgi:hypothetical protein